MSYKNLADCITDLESNSNLKKISKEVNPFLEIADII